MVAHLFVVWYNTQKGDDMTTTRILPEIKPNIILMEDAFKDCADLKKKPMKLGIHQDVEAYLIYIEVAVDTGTSVLGQTLRFLNEKDREDILSCLKNNALAIPDATFFATIEEAIDGVLTGETILFVDGFPPLSSSIYHPLTSISIEALDNPE